jgi:tetratricopeptide (TPR) repeat protein
MGIVFFGFVAEAEELDSWYANSMDWSIEPFEKPAEAARSYLRRARAYLHEKEPAAALLYLYEALDKDPDRGVLLLYMGYAHLRLKELDKAIDCFVRASRVAPRDAQAFRYAGRCHELAGRLEPAIDWSLDALLRSPGDERLWTDLDRLARRTGRTLRRRPIHKRALVRRNEDGEFSILIERREEDPVAMAWLSYAATRARWVSDLYLKFFPESEDYRHTFREESEAWKAMVTTWREMKQSDPQLVDADLDRVADLEARGLLDGYIFVEEFDSPFAEEEMAVISHPAARRYLREVVLDVQRD